VHGILIASISVVEAGIDVVLDIEINPGVCGGGRQSSEGC
jgi:hypothetical protein